MIELVLGVVVVIGILLYRGYRGHLRRLQVITDDFFATEEELYKTIAAGLYHRFKKRNTKDGEKAAIDTPYQKDSSDENPYTFEEWVASVMQKYRGGYASSTKASGDYGVDIEHSRDGGLFLGQVKCYPTPVNYEPIAIIHSQMVKQNAQGGFVVTTSEFTPNAKKYAAETNIELIEGTELAKIWILSQKSQYEFLKQKQLQNEAT
ncbi:restriction endonuclease [Brevibacillus sp. AY1]|uniref:restriction endonuclease n=1 Tax=Brevibacillus sp. AY1 TaxID=2807621 RepID=UPI0024551B2D|nr:restriction endonuclease [Brevibacillus sp. AY1]MDH4620193.1 restriction endonuclease [Brevibacillus sp. AY1]